MTEPGARQLLARIIDINPPDGSRASPIDNGRLERILAALDLIVETTSRGHLVETRSAYVTANHYLALRSAQRGSLQLLFDIVTGAAEGAKVLKDTVDIAEKLFSIAASSAGVTASIVAVSIACRNLEDRSKDKFGDKINYLIELLEAGADPRDLFAFSEIAKALGPRRALELVTRKSRAYFSGLDLAELLNDWPDLSQGLASDIVLVKYAGFDETDIVYQGKMRTAFFTDKNFAAYLAETKPVFAGAAASVRAQYANPHGDLVIDRVEKARFIDGNVYDRLAMSQPDEGS